jgi:Ca-activated chloride channel family protein
MTFAAPHWLWAFTFFPLLLALALAAERRRAELIAKLVATRLAPRLAGTASRAKRWLRFALLLLGLAAVVLALARPQWGFTWEQSKRKGRDVLLVIDVSRSMLADDLKPNRLSRAKLAAQTLVGELQGDRVGVIAFAGTAFLQAPLTVDYGAVINSLRELDTEIIPQGGSNLEGALRAAREAFGKGESENRALVIFSDGEELDADAKKAIDELQEQVRIFCVGLGTPEGALIPVRKPGGGVEFVRDEAGQPVRSRLDESRLRAIAEATGGFYLPLQAGRPEMQRIVRDGLGQMTEQDIDARLSRRPIERYQWPLSAALAALGAALLIGERRRGSGRRRPLAAALLLPFAAQAKNAGIEAYQRQDYEGARKDFAAQIERRPDSPELQFNLGAAAYKAGDYDAALGAFSRAVTSSDPRLRGKAAYNLGNTLFQRGQGQADKAAKIAEWKNALQHYDEALKVAPQDEDAAFNRDVVQRLIAQLEQEPPKQDEQKPDDKKQEEKKDEEKQDKQQKQDGSPQDQPQSGDEQKNESSKDGSSPPQKNETGGDEKEAPQSSSGGENQEQQSKPQKQEQAGQKPESRDGGEKGREAGGQPTPPEQSGEKKQGELKSAAQGQPGDREEAPAEAADEALAAQEGRMTPQQARALLESLKTEDEKVRLFEPKPQRGKRVFKDW